MKSRLLMASIAIACLAGHGVLAQDLNTMTNAELLKAAQREKTVTVYSFTSRISKIRPTCERA